MNAERRKEIERRGQVLGKMEVGKFARIWNEVTAGMGDYKKKLLLDEITRSVKMAERARLIKKPRAMKAKARSARAQASA